MFGSRKRIGYISPSVLEVVPYDFYRFAPEGVGLVGVTCNIDDWTQEHFDRALGQVKKAAAYLGSRQVDYIVHGGGPLGGGARQGLRRPHRQRHPGGRKGAGDDRRALRHGGAAARRRAPHRHRIALS